jgi:hypothetical protein
MNQFLNMKHLCKFKVWQYSKLNKILKYSQLFLLILLKIRRYLPDIMVKLLRNLQYSLQYSV